MGLKSQLDSNLIKTSSNDRAEPCNHLAKSAISLTFCALIKLARLRLARPYIEKMEEEKTKLCPTPSIIESKQNLGGDKVSS